MHSINVCVCVFSPKDMSNSFATPWTVARQAPLLMGFPRQNTRMGCHFLLQGIFSIQGSNPDLLYFRRILHHLSHQGNPLLAKDNLKKMKEQMVRCLGKYVPGRGNNTSLQGGSFRFYDAKSCRVLNTIKRTPPFILSK